MSATILYLGGPLFLGHSVHIKVTEEEERILFTNRNDCVGANVFHESVTAKPNEAGM